MKRKQNNNESENYTKIKKVCKIMIDDLSQKVLNIGLLEEGVKLWKNDDSVLEVLTKLVTILNKLDSTDEKKVISKQISKNDFLALEEFVKNYDKSIKVEP